MADDMTGRSSALRSTGLTTHLFRDKPKDTKQWDWEYQQINDAMRAGIGEAEWVKNETESRRTQRIDFLQAEQDLASQPTMTNADIERQYGKAADQATVDAQALMRSLREQMGQSGVRGGTAAGIGAQVELQRLGQLTDAKRDLQIFKANADAQDRINRYMRAFGISEVIGQEPSPFLSDALQSLAGVRLGQYEMGIQGRLGVFQINAAKDMAKSNALAGGIGSAINLGAAALGA